MVDFGWLSFLAEPWFVVPFFAVGAIAAGWVVYDLRKVNTAVSTSHGAAWPIIVFFFSVIGLAFYLFTSRPGDIGRYEGEEKQKRFSEYAAHPFKMTTGSVIHCVGGDGLGIMTAMIAARVFDMNFWQEFWLEYAVGYAFGWFIFQYKAMSMHTSSIPRALYMAGRGEWFSMLTVMAGMGATMGFITPLAVGEQPNPDTYAFWGFAALGLFLGFLLTYPMNWMLVKVGYKHGLG